MKFLFAVLMLAQVDPVAAAWADAQKLPADARANARYLSLENLPATDLIDAAKVLSGHVNGLSRESDITPPAIVPGSALRLLRVNLDDYGWKREAWEQLAEADPYYHVRVETAAGPAVALPAGFEWRTYAESPGQFFLLQNGKTVGGWDSKAKVYFPFANGQFGAAATKAPVALPKIVLALAPWLSPKIADLAAATQSRVPIVRADWFLNQTAAMQNRKPNYFDFLGVKDEKDFQRVIGFDAKLAESFGRELREAVADSGVTLQPRAIVRHNTLGGAYWRSFDFKVAKDRANPLRVLGKDVEAEYTATEQYGSLPNGLWAMGIFDREGKAQDAAPGDIASDHLSKSNDRQVHNAASCIRCHSNGGLKDIDGWVRNLLQPPLSLSSPDYRKLRELRQQYLRKLEPFIAKDRANYEDAIKEATGWDSKTYASRFAAFWERYEDARVDATWAAKDCGVETKEFVWSLKSYAQASGSLDPVLSVFLLEGHRQRTVGIRQWEEAFPLAMQILKGTRK